MNDQRKHTVRAFAVGALLLAVGAGAAFAILLSTHRVRAERAGSESAPYNRAQTMQTNGSDFKRTVARWQATFLTRDVGVAYAQFIAEGNGMQSDESHVVAHIVGGILYDMRGLAGLSLCTDDFNYGCYHGFASRVIEERGTAGISDLTEGCKRVPTVNCEHGIGHGLMVLFGDAQLNEALRACSSFSRRIGGCANGVFMEYYLNSMRLDNNRGPLAFDEHTPDTPCSVVSNKGDLEVCYYTLPVLWRSKVRSAETVPAQFTYVGEMCERVTDPHMRASCFSGVGAMAVPVAEFDEHESLKLCAVMPRDGTALCETAALDYLTHRTHSDV